MLAAAALAHATAALRQAGVENPRREARLLLAHALGIPPATLLPTSTAQIDDAALNALLARRAAHEPLAYITGTRGFWSLDLAVSPATLIPRPDTETLIQAALDHFPDRTRPLRILDLGTGTGALLLSALTEFPLAIGIGTDISPAAIALAATNANHLHLRDRCLLLSADWAAPLATTFDLILCNPPYIPSADIPALMPEVAAHEPASALDGGPDGLAAYVRIIPTLPYLLAPGALACLELGAGQAEAVTALARQAGFTQIRLRQDLAGIDRALLLGSPREKTFGMGAGGG